MSTQEQQEKWAQPPAPPVIGFDPEPGWIRREGDAKIGFTTQPPAPEGERMSDEELNEIQQNAGAMTDIEFRNSVDADALIHELRALRRSELALRERAEKAEADAALVNKILVDICKEWNEDCDPKCDSYGHEDTCKYVYIAEAKRALHDRIAALEAALAERDARIANVKRHWAIVCGGEDTNAYKMSVLARLLDRAALASPAEAATQPENKE